MKRKRVVIDASAILPLKNGYLSGVGRTILELINELQKIDDLPFDIVLFGQRLRRDRFQRYDFSFPIRYLPVPRWKSLSWVRKNLPIVEMLTGADVLHIPSNYAPVFAPEKAIVTLHDAMFLSHPETHLHRADETREIVALANACHAVITCSESSKRDLVEMGGIDEKKIHVILWACNKNSFHEIQDRRLVGGFLSKRFRIESPYFLCVSCSSGRKSTPAVVDNYLAMAEHGTKNHLVLVWPNPPADLCRKVATHKRGENVHFITNVDDRDLRYLYNGATVLLYPSAYEGFGLPILEAMACGTPVVTCNVSSLPEVGGDAAIYIDPGDWSALSAEMENFEQGTYDMEDLRKKCLAQADRFSWRKCALETLRIYRNCLGMAG